MVDDTHIHVTQHAVKRYRERVNPLKNPVKAIQNAVRHSGECTLEEARRRYGRVRLKGGVLIDSGSFLVVGVWERNGQRFVVKTVWCP